MAPLLSLPVLVTALLGVLLLIWWLSRSVARDQRRRRRAPLQDVQTPAEQREDLRTIDVPLGGPLAGNARGVLDDLGPGGPRD